MPFALILGALSLITTVVGVGLQVAGAATQADAAKRTAEETKRQEDIRQQQTNLESARQKRQVIRNALRARSQALIASTSSGAQGSSGEAGGFAQIGNQAGENTLGINQAKQGSDAIFSSNKNIADAQSLAAFGGGLSSLGQSISGLKFG